MAHLCGRHCCWPEEIHCCLPQCYEWYQLVGPISLHCLQLHTFVRLSFLTLWSYRSTEHDHIKANLPAKLLRIRTFAKMELEEFKNLISAADYKLCEKTREDHPTWYKLTANVFVKFLYKVSLRPLSPITLSHSIAFIIILSLSEGDFCCCRWSCEVVPWVHTRGPEDCYGHLGGHVEGPR
jgi:hypothetical protein